MRGPGRRDLGELAEAADVDVRVGGRRGLSREFSEEATRGGVGRGRGRAGGRVVVVVEAETEAEGFGGGVAERRAEARCCLASEAASTALASEDVRWTGEATSSASQSRVAWLSTRDVARRRTDARTARAERCACSRRAALMRAFSASGSCFGS